MNDKWGTYKGDMSPTHTDQCCSSFSFFSFRLLSWCFCFSIVLLLLFSLLFGRGPVQPNAGRLEFAPFSSRRPLSHTHHTHLFAACRERNVGTDLLSTPIGKSQWPVYRTRLGLFSLTYSPLFHTPFFDSLKWDELERETQTMFCFGLCGGHPSCLTILPLVLALLIPPRRRGDPAAGAFQPMRTQTHHPGSMPSHCLVKAGRRWRSFHTDVPLPPPELEKRERLTGSNELKY
ncbi:hypothetical protein QBC46DRAFT_156277 [Diplogelasinospora grovesii]|uniref:Uncharacterized protein n=1 Tax=Diplogelasinospora grovesii TaxID=303347 RepID=A0AAN6S3S6_9PEZI|nr:hypothetical protein QBC46DRAFT_156277 [Diplogelasinospora grovesii]